jgi:hypothetical protein
MRISSILTTVVKPLRRVAASRRNLLTAARRGGECLVPARHASPVRELTGLSTAHLSQLGVSPVGPKRFIHGGPAGETFMDGVSRVIGEFNADPAVKVVLEEVDRPSDFDDYDKGILEHMDAVFKANSVESLEVFRVILWAAIGILDMSEIKDAIDRPLEEFGALKGDYGFISDDRFRGMFERAALHLLDNTHLLDQLKSPEERALWFDSEIQSWMDEAGIDWSHQVMQLFNFFEDVRDFSWKSAVEAYLCEDFVDNFLSGYCSE